MTKKSGNGPPIARNVANGCGEANVGGDEPT